MASELLRPRALLTHLLVLSVAATCVALGNWQQGRLTEVRANNALLEERLDNDPIDLTRLSPADWTSVDQDENEFQPARVTGRYRPGEEVLQRNRNYRGQQGFHLLTPLELDDGRVVLIRRGWVPAQFSDPPVAEAAPPHETVTIRGVLEPSASQPDFGPQDTAEGDLDLVFHADTELLNQRIEGELFPMILRLEEQQPALQSDPGAFPLPLDPPVLDEANHLSYMVQWYSFAALAVVTYGAWLWTNHRRRSLRAGTTDRSDLT